MKNNYPIQKWARINYQPCLPLGDNNSKITGSKKHIDLARKAATEGIVLLKNSNNILPLKKGTKVAIFGKAQIDYVHVGGGSGYVFSDYVTNIYEGLKQKQNIDIFDSLSLYYQDYVEKIYRETEDGGMYCGKSGKFDEADIPEDLLLSAKEFTDTAIITICRFSQEGNDRKNDGTEFYYDLSPKEKEMVKTVLENFEKVIVLLNTGAMIDTSWFANNDKVAAALMIWQGGMEGGLATADILTGAETPSGKLVDTCSSSFDDYPSSEGFHESPDYVKYTEDIFVGYRYFETIPNASKKVVYPFGYGLSYTQFEIKNCTAIATDNKIFVSCEVKNTGAYKGKEVVQIYFGVPGVKITNPARQLCAFAKTKCLLPGESESLSMSFDIRDMASYDDTGVIEKSTYVMEAGVYKFFLGNNVRDAKELEYKYELKEDKIVEKLTEYLKPTSLGKRLTASGEYVDIPDCEYVPKTFDCTYKNEYKPHDSNEKTSANELGAVSVSYGEVKKLIDVANCEISLDDFISQLDNRELIHLLGGQPNTGVANTAGMGNLEKYGIPNAMTVDGPAGVRINPNTGITATTFPVATMLAATWNLELVEAVGAAGAKEAKENNLAIWLTPALNIHRSPLCGRNFEYYSEDPYMSGKMAAAMVRGIQSQRIVATPKHFACNNKEINRKFSDSIVSERALREIYLKGFEICVKESVPKLIMTSYNLINGVYASESAELLEGILRREWGFRGLVTTDWVNGSSKYTEIIAGNDIRMPDIRTTATIANRHGLRIEYDFDDLAEKSGRDRLALSVKKLLEMLLWLE